MGTVVKVLRDLAIGGVLFLIPLGVIVLVFTQLFEITAKIGDAISATLFPGVRSEVLVLLLALLLLLAVALAAGIFARTSAGRSLFRALEQGVLARLPIYPVIKQVMADMAGDLDQLTDGKELEVVAVHFDDSTQVGFLVDELENGRMVVFLLGAPSALSGTVVIVDPDRVVTTELKPQQVIGAMRRLGANVMEMVVKAGVETKDPV